MPHFAKPLDFSLGFWDFLGGALAATEMGLRPGRLAGPNGEETRQVSAWGSTKSGDMPRETKGNHLIGWVLSVPSWRSFIVLSFEVRHKLKYYTHLFHLYPPSYCYHFCRCGDQQAALYCYLVPWHLISNMVKTSAASTNRHGFAEKHSSRFWCTLSLARQS